MKFCFSVWIAALATVLPALAMAEEATAPEAAMEITLDDLTAIPHFENGDLAERGLPGRYTAAQVNTFLEQFVGVWEGGYTITTMEGQVVQQMDTQATYDWQLVGETPVLRGQAVFAVGESLSVATSLSYHWLGRIVSEIESDGVKRIYLGVINEAGDSVAWSPANAEDFTRSTSRETFTVKDGRRTLVTKGYEDHQHGPRHKVFLLRGELFAVTPVDQAL